MEDEIFDNVSEEVVDLQESTESTELSTDVEETQEQPVVEEPVVEEKPKQSAEENARYAAIRREAEEKAKLKARDEVIKEMYGDQGINTYAEYQEALRLQEEQERLQELTEQDIPEDIAKELLESRKIRQELERQQQEQAEKEQVNRMYSEFVETFPNVDAANIPSEVWQMVESGKDLTSAYAIYQVRNVDKIKIDAQQEALKSLKNNAETSTGSVNAGTGAEIPSMSNDQVDTLLKQMDSKDRSKWIDSNMDNLEKWGYFKKY